MKPRILVSGLLLSLFASLGSAASLTIGVESGDYMPISKGEGANYSGYARELLDAFAAKSGHQLTYKPMPVARLYDEFLVQKSVDLKFPDNANWNGDMKKGLSIAYSKGAVTVVEGVMVVPANKGKALDKLAKIGTLRGFTPWPYMDRIKAKQLAVNEVNSVEAGVSMAEAGRIDGIYLGVIPANYVMTEALKKPGALVLDDKLPTSSSAFSLSSHKHPEVVKQFDEFLAKEKDTVSKLRAKYKIVE